MMEGFGLDLIGLG